MHKKFYTFRFIRFPFNFYFNKTDRNNNQKAINTTFASKNQTSPSPIINLLIFFHENRKNAEIPYLLRTKEYPQQISTQFNRNYHNIIAQYTSFKKKKVAKPNFNQIEIPLIFSSNNFKHFHQTDRNNNQEAINATFAYKNQNFTITYHKFLDFAIKTGRMQNVDFRQKSKKNATKLKRNLRLKKLLGQLTIFEIEKMKMEDKVVKKGRIIKRLKNRHLFVCFIECLMQFIKVVLSSSFFFSPLCENGMRERR